MRAVLTRILCKPTRLSVGVRERVQFGDVCVQRHNGGGHLSGSLCLLSCSLDVSHTNRLNKRPLCAHTHSRVSYPSHTSAIIIMMKCAQNCKRLIVRRIMRVGYLNECVCACLCACLYVLMCTMLGRDA